MGAFAIGLIAGWIVVGVIPAAYVLWDEWRASRSLTQFWSVSVYVVLVALMLEVWWLGRVLMEGRVR